MEDPLDESLKTIQTKGFDKQYHAILHLLHVQSKNDPLDDQHRSAKAALPLLIALNDDLAALAADDQAHFGQPQQLTAFLQGSVQRDLFVVCSDLGDRPLGEKYAKQCLATADGLRANRDGLNLFLSAMNELSLMLQADGKLTDAEQMMQQAIELYESFDPAADPVRLHERLQPADRTSDAPVAALALQRTHTYTLFFMAQLKGMLQKSDEAMHYCHVTLKHRLQWPDVDQIDWALNAATLSQLFMSKNRFPEARHHVAAAMHMMRRHEQWLRDATMNEEERAAAEETFRHRMADVRRCAAKYALNLLQVSRDRLVDDKLAKELAKLQLNTSPARYAFDSIDVSEFEALITCAYARTYDEAKPVFKAALQWLLEAKVHYSLDSQASEYAAIVNDECALYNALAFFDDEPSNQCKMHKRAIVLLETMLAQMNVLFYRDVFRSAWNDIGLNYAKIIDAKHDMYNDSVNELSEPERLQRLQKMEVLVGKCSEAFGKFSRSYMEKDGETLLRDQNADVVNAVMAAFFHPARLYYKLTVMPGKRFQYMQTSHQFYKKFMRMYEEQRPVHGQRMAEEFSVCREMVGLMEVTMARIGPSRSEP